MEVGETVLGGDTDSGGTKDSDGELVCQDVVGEISKYPAKGKVSLSVRGIS